MQLLNYHCMECGFTGNVSTKNGIVKCPACGTKNDVWMEGEAVPARHTRMQEQYWQEKKATELIDELSFDKSAAFRTNLSEMAASAKKADPLRKRYPEKPLTEIKKKKMGTIAEELQRRKLVQADLLIQSYIEKTAGNVPWHGIRVAIRDSDRDAHTLRDAYKKSTPEG